MSEPDKRHNRYAHRSEQINSLDLDANHYIAATQVGSAVVEFEKGPKAGKLLKSHLAPPPPEVGLFEKGGG